jgi:hypothetical protein
MELIWATRLRFMLQKNFTELSKSMSSISHQHKKDNFQQKKQKKFAALVRYFVDLKQENVT